MAKLDPRLPAQDRKVISMSKEARAEERVRQLKELIVYYKKWWLPSLVLGTVCLITTLYNFDFTQDSYSIYSHWYVGAAFFFFPNGLYFLYKSFREKKKMKLLKNKLEAFRLEKYGYAKNDENEFEF